MKSEIVEDGAKRRIDTKAVLQRRNELKEELEGKYADELKTSSWLKRLQIKCRIRRIINKTIKEEYQQSLYNLNGRVKL